MAGWPRLSVGGSGGRAQLQLRPPAQGPQVGGDTAMEGRNKECNITLEPLLFCGFWLACRLDREGRINRLWLKPMCQH